MDSGVELDCIYNIDATKCYSNLLLRKIYQQRPSKHTNNIDSVNSGVYNCIIFQLTQHIHILQVNDFVVFEQQTTATLQDNVEYAAHYLLNKLPLLAICSKCHNGRIRERVNNNVFKLYDQ